MANGRGGMRDSDGAKKTNETMGRSGKRMHDVLKLMKTANNKEERRQIKRGLEQHRARGREKASPT